MSKNSLAWYHANRDKALASNKCWRQANKDSIKAKSKEWRIKNKDSITQRNKSRYAANKEQMRKDARDAHFRRKYGITLHQRDAEVAARNSLCDVCQRHSNLNIDHCHTSGIVRGYLCTGCNITIGHIGDSPELLRRLADYLEGNI